jgi:predicted dehydrogenase
VRLCEEKGVLLAVNYQRNWDPQMSRLGQAIRAGELGPVQLIRVLYSKGLVHNGSHFISLLHAWFGELHVQQILAVRRRTEEDVYADFTATCPKAPRVIFQNISERAYTVHEMECFCANGRLEVNQGGLELRWTGKEHDPLLPNESTLAGRSQKIPATLDRAMLEVIRNVTAALRGDERLKCGPENALKTLHFCERVRSLSGNCKAYE